MCTDETSVLHSFTKDLQDLISAVEADTTAPVVDNYDKEIHWHKMGLACEAVSKECTKLAVAFSKPPTPSVQDSQLLLRDVLKAVDVLIAWFKTFPLTEGKVLHSILHKCITRIIYSVRDFMNSTDTGILLEGRDRFVNIGTIWEYCDRFKSLPKNNCTAAFHQIDHSYKLVSDALDEVIDSVKEHDENILNDIDDDDREEDEEQWNENDRKLIKPCTGFLMASRGLLKKCKTAVNSLHNTESNINNTEIDHLIELVEHISPSVDDFVMSIYPPVNRNDLLSQAMRLKKTIEEMLIYIRSTSTFGVESNISWIDFIHKALDHNLHLLNNLIPNI